MPRLEGHLFIGPDAEALKERIDTIGTIRDVLDNADMSDPNYWIIHASSEEAIFITGQHQMPSIAYALTHMLLSLRGMAGAVSESMRHHVEAAIAQAAEEASAGAGEKGN